MQPARPDTVFVVHIQCCFICRPWDSTVSEPLRLVGLTSGLLQLLHRLSDPPNNSDLIRLEGYLHYELETLYTYHVTVLPFQVGTIYIYFLNLHLRLNSPPDQKFLMCKIPRWKKCPEILPPLSSEETWIINKAQRSLRQTSDEGGKVAVYPPLPILDL